MSDFALCCSLRQDQSVSRSTSAASKVEAVGFHSPHWEQIQWRAPSQLGGLGGVGTFGVVSEFSYWKHSQGVREFEEIGLALLESKSALWEYPQRN